MPKGQCSESPPNSARLVRCIDVSKQAITCDPFQRRKEKPGIGAQLPPARTSAAALPAAPSLPEEAAAVARPKPSDTASGRPFLSRIYWPGRPMTGGGDQI